MEADKEIKISPLHRSKSSANFVLVSLVDRVKDAIGSITELTQKLKYFITKELGGRPKANRPGGPLIWFRVLKMALDIVQWIESTKKRRLSNSSIEKGVPGPDLRQHTSAVDFSDKESVQPSDFLCLYTEVPKNSRPSHIKKGQADAPILQVLFPSDLDDCIDFPEADDCPVNVECFSACVEEMFGGLITEPNDSNIWKEKSKTRNLVTRTQQCSAIMDSYRLNVPEVVIRLRTLYYAFTHGCYNAVGREGMCGLFSLGLLLSGDTRDIMDCFLNVGGSSTTFPGISKIVPLYCNLSELSAEVSKDAIKDEFKVEEGQHRHFIPDVVLFNASSLEYEERKFCFFGEVKSKKMTDSTGYDTLLNQVWHQSLRGLVDYDVSYGCALFSLHILLVQLKVDKSKNILLTYKKDFDMRKTIGPGTYEFNTANFISFMKLFIKMIQEGKVLT